MKRITMVLLATALLCGALAFAASAAEPYFDIEGDFRYHFFDDHAQISAYVGSGGAAVIPETVRGVPVTSIASNAFTYNRLNGDGLNSGKVTSISIPRYLVGFYGPFGADLDGVFFDCVGVTAYTVDPLNEAFCAVDGVLFSKDMTKLYAYPTGSSLTEYTIPDGVRFSNSVDFGDLESLIVGNDVTRVPPLSGKLRKLSLPASFAFASDAGVSYTNAFNSCASLEEITVHPDNPDYTVQDGVLFNKSMTTLIVCPQKLNIGDYTIPNSVTSIVQRAFSGCTGLTGFVISGDNPNDYSNQDGVLFNKDKTTLLCYPAGRPGSSYTLPNSVTAYASYAFERNQNLTEIYFPEGVTGLGTNAFYGCTNLTLYGYYYTPLRTASRPTGVRFVAVDAPRIDSITIAPSGTLTLDVGDSVQFTVTIEGYNLRDETKRVTWYLLASGGGNYLSTISTNGLLRVNVNEIQPLLQAGAYSTYDSTMRASTNIIVKWPPADKTYLNTLIAQAEGKVNDTRYTEASRAALQTVLANAKTVRDMEAPQVLVDSTALVLRDAINALQEYQEPVTVASLNQKIAEAEGKVNDAQYTTASRAALQTAIAQAKRVRDDEAPSELMISNAIDALNNAISALEKVVAKEYFTLWGKTTTWEKTTMNWILLIFLFGWIWMAF